jgi:glycosyltransferase involved in cell wall biosynthesis
MKQIAVVIMVKNESNTILRCLESVLKIVPDLVIITDTGSTDDTIVKAGMFLQERGLAFKIYQEKFVDFGHNRTLLLQYARKEAHIDYVLMIDADDIFEYDVNYHPVTFRDKLTRDIYNIHYKDNSVSYYLPKLTSNKVNFEYIGVTHEYLDAKNYSQDLLTDFQTFQFNDGHRRISNIKLRHDIELMTTALETTPSGFLRGRMLFYLGNTHKILGEYEAAINCYKQRLELGGWTQELFYCHYSLAQIFSEITHQDFLQAMYHLSQAIGLCPERREAFVLLKNLLIRKNMASIGIYFTAIINKIGKPKDALFLEHNLYEPICQILPSHILAGEA